MLFCEQKYFLCTRKLKLAKHIRPTFWTFNMVMVTRSSRLTLIMVTNHMQTDVDYLKISLYKEHSVSRTFFGNHKL